MAKKRVARADARFIRDRLQRFAIERNGSWAAFVEDVEIGRTTGANWMSRRDPSVPEPGWLIELARRANISLNWLLLGAGPRLITAEAQTPAEQVCAAIQAELRLTESLSAEEFIGAWSRILTGQDWGRRPDVTSADTVFQLAVEGVRVHFRESLRLARHQAAIGYITHLKELVEPANEWPQAQVSEADVERRRRLVERAEGRLDELMNASFDQFFEELESIRRRHRAEDRENLEDELRGSDDSSDRGEPEARPK